MGHCPGLADTPNSSRWLVEEDEAHPPSPCRCPFLPSFAALRATNSVVDSLEAPLGKYPSLLGNVVVMEMSYFQAALRDYLRSAAASLATIALAGQAGGGLGCVLEGPLTSVLLDSFVDPIVTMVDLEVRYTHSIDKAPSE